MITLYQYATKYGLPNVSPFCMKVENYLRMNALNYETALVVNPAKTPKGKAPYIVDGEKVVADSAFILDYLEGTYHCKINHVLNEQQKACAHVIAAALEERLYFAMVYSRWIEEASWQELRQLWFRHLPPVVRTLVANMARRSVKKSLHGHGMGRHNANEIYALGCKDIDALAVLLGSQDFMLGEQMTRIDATAYAFMANIIQVPLSSPLQDRAMGHSNLIEYCKRMGHLLYPELPHLQKI